MKAYEELKQIVLAKADALANEAIELSKDIYEHPEVSGQEFYACEVLSNYLNNKGFAVKTGVAKLPTAFTAETGRGIHLAFTAEYDALPQIGHGCGHSLIAPASMLAACALKDIVAEIGAKISVIGTPSEEHGSMKIQMIDEGLFKEVDFAMMAHPTTIANTATISSYAITDVRVVFRGKAAHAAASPSEGINALDAMILSFTAINALRQQTTDEARIHGVITHGGDAPNIIPEMASASFMVRSKSDKYLKTLVDKVCDIFKGAALQTGCQVEIAFGHTCLNMKNNGAMALAYIESMKELGKDVEFFAEDVTFGSTDMGNVSHVVPSIHPLFKIADIVAVPHSSDFCAIAGTAQAYKEMVATAKGLAIAALKILTSNDLQKQIKNDFKEQS